jgi:hypothetical protein
MKPNEVNNYRMFLKVSVLLMILTATILAIFQLAFPLAVCIGWAVCAEIELVQLAIRFKEDGRMR